MLPEEITFINLRPPMPGFGHFLGCYLVRGQKMALIDVGPACSIPHLLAELERLGVRGEEIAYGLLTHIHIDHAGGAGHLAKHWPHIQWVVHPRAREHLINPQRLWQGSLQTLGEMARQYGEIKPLPEASLIVATEGMELDLGSGVVLQAFLTPGHAPHHLSIFYPRRRHLFAGEACGVFANGAIRVSTPPPLINIDLMLQSLDKLIQLNPLTISFGHFGDTDNAVARLEGYKQALLLWWRVIKEAVGRGLSIDEMYPLILEKDPSLSYIADLPPSEKERERFFVLNSLRGMTAALKR